MSTSQGPTDRGRGGAEGSPGDSGAGWPAVARALGLTGDGSAEGRASASAPQDTEARALEWAAAAAHGAMAKGQAMPAGIRERLEREATGWAGKGLRSGNGGAPAGSPGTGSAGEPGRPGRGRRPMGRAFPWLIAAGVSVAAGIALWFASQGISQRDRELAALRTQFESMRTRADENERLLASAERARAELDRSQGELTEKDRLAQARILELTRALASASGELDAMRSDMVLTRTQLDEARLTIARASEPVDPATLAQNRAMLAGVPDSVQIAWAPFEVPGLPPVEQPGVSGDVIWNDRLQTGYLRFVGLDPNDPNVEQYQVWVIDERGMEQKVSGGVFDVTAEGEVIVPIVPGIDVGRVALFAVTVENAGGTWVPDLKRRVVVAPREG